MPSQGADRLAAANAAFRRSFLDRANGDLELAARLRSEFFSEMGRRSGARRRAIAAERARAQRAALAVAASVVGAVDESRVLQVARQQRQQRR
jgi:hypothetical protein